MDASEPPAKGEIRRLPGEVVVAFAEHAEELIDAPRWRLVLLASAAGGFIAIGAMISLAISAGVETEAAARLLLGVGFATGFMMVILTGAALITEVNVVLPELMFSGRRRLSGRQLQTWLLILVGNVLGIFVIGFLIGAADVVGESEAVRLATLIEEKSRFRDLDAGWLRAVASGVLGNWLVGMAAFLAAAARTVPGKMLGVLFPVVGFVAIGVQHAPANLGYFAIAAASGELGGASWGDLVLWNLLPALLGNMIGGATLVAAILWFAYGRSGGSRT